MAMTQNYDHRLPMTHEEAKNLLAFLNLVRPPRLHGLLERLKWIAYPDDNLTEQDEQEIFARGNSYFRDEFIYGMPEEMQGKKYR